MMQARFFLVLLLGFTAGAAAQQLYRWTDDKGRVHVTDTLPPVSARDVQKAGTSSAGAAASAALPFEVAQAQKDFPVTLYTSPPCKDPCDRARGILNRRGIPFSEVIVWDEDSHEKLKKLTGSSDEVPVITVGRSVQKGYDADAYDALLDSARYPKTGSLPARTQAAPALPEGYVGPGGSTTAKAEPVKPEAEEQAPAGPYSPGSKPPPRRAPQQK